MNRSQATVLVVSGLVAAGLAVLSMPAAVGTASPPPVAMTTGPGTSQAPAYPEGAAEYDAATAALPLPLPVGYDYPADPEITGPWAETLAWDHWLAANADAALRAQAAGEVDAVAALQDALRAAWDLHFSARMAQNASLVLDAINDGDFALIQQMFQLPAGMSRP